MKLTHKTKEIESRLNFEDLSTGDVFLFGIFSDEKLLNLTAAFMKLNIDEYVALSDTSVLSVGEVDKVFSRTTNVTKLDAELVVNP